MAGAPELVHGTAIALRQGATWRAALIRGASGAGKSDLALRCLAATPSNGLLNADVALVADDQVHVACRAPKLEARCPAALRGKLEVRGIGIIEVRSIDAADLALVVDLVPRTDVPRLPDPPSKCALQGITLPLLLISAFEASAPLKLLLALQDPAVLGEAQGPSARR